MKMKRLAALVLCAVMALLPGVCSAEEVRLDGSPGKSRGDAMEKEAEFFSRCAGEKNQ